MQDDVCFWIVYNILGVGISASLEVQLPGPKEVLIESSYGSGVMKLMGHIVLHPIHT
jgi:hypothetical protein